MTISKTFCPAKWDEILVNLSANYVYSCCKAKPIRITKKEDIAKALNQQKQNLLEGIQDSACDYCWKIENSGHESPRQYQYLKSFDHSKFENYKNNQINLKKIEISLGNECNFQCIYCNPKFSSQWETDVKNKPYKIFSDRYFYAIDEKNTNNISDTMQWLEEYKSIEKLEIIGGEPLQNKNFFKIINLVNSKELGFSTNLSCKTYEPIDKIFNIADKYEKISFHISIDSTGKNAEFSRYGMDFERMLKNINYVLSNAPSQIEIKFLSLMSSITVRDFDNIVDLIDNFYNLRPKNIIWDISYCQNPLILSMNTLLDHHKLKILEKISAIEDRKYISGLDSLKGVILTSTFNKTLYNQLKHFLEEFSSRKNIAIPVILD